MPWRRATHSAGYSWSETEDQEWHDDNVLPTGPEWLHCLQGVVDIQDNDLTLSENSDVSGTFTSGNMISADGSGYFIREISTAGTYFFPIGDLTSGADYSPVELDFTSGTFNNASVSVNLSNNKHPDNPSTTDYLNRYWILSSSGISGFSCDMTFEYVSGDIVGNEANIRGAIRKNEGWRNLG